jgi:chemotaxis methyl-accepting protein methylase
VAAGMHRALREGGMLVIGQHEKLPEAVNGFTSLSDTHRVYRRDNSGADKTHGSRPLC